MQPYSLRPDAHNRGAETAAIFDAAEEVAHEIEAAGGEAIVIGANMGKVRTPLVAECRCAERAL